MIRKMFNATKFSAVICLCLFVMTHLTGCQTPEDKVRAASEDLGKTALNREKTTVGRCWAVKSLDRLPPQLTYPTLMKLAKKKHTPLPLRRRAIWALGRTSMSAAVPPVTEALEQAQEEKTAYWACTALAKLSPNFQDLAPAERREIFDAVNAAQARFAASGRIREMTALLLSRAGAGDLFDILKKAVNKRPDGWRQRAFAALCRLGDRIVENPEVVGNDVKRQAIAQMCDLTESNSAMLQYKSIWYLGRIASEKAADTLRTKMLHAEDARTRLLASWALWRTDPERFEKEADPVASTAIPPEPETWRKVRKEARELGERNLQIHRLWNDLLREEAVP